MTSAPRYSQSPKRIVMLAYDGANALDVTGPLDVLAGSTVARDEPLPDYVIEVASPAGGVISTSPSGVRIETKSFAALKGQSIDTLFVAGSEAVELAVNNKALIKWIQRVAPRARRVASVCTGAFLLAEAGLLNDRRATTHWRWANALSTGYPTITVEPDRIYVRDENIYTSAGISAGMDLALALLEEDLGANVAREVARNWVMYAKRPGGQSQFSALLPEVDEADHGISEVLAWIHDHLTENLSIDRLAGVSKMSPRNFSRRFRLQTGFTPAKYVETIRLQAAQARLENSNQSVESIAAKTGFTNSERMRRAFVRQLKISPQDYRNRFQFQ
ncbi:MAG: GlxA family transcriptional regulator [Gammaproteobacteria bacterium]